ncbi:MAG: hypothetical protein AAGF77_04730 [Bacteroidota bacterium]
MRYFNKTVLLVFLLGITGLYAQQEEERPLALINQVYTDSIVLRWAPRDLNIWSAIRAHGVQVHRIATSKGTDDIVNTSPITPYTLQEWQAKTNTDNPYVVTAADALWGTPEITQEKANQSMSNQVLATQEQKNKFTMAMFSAEFSKQAANGLALRYVDTDVEKTDSYSYYVTVADSLRSNILFTGMEKPWEVRPVVEVALETKGETITVKWPKEVNNAFFTGYYVERSLDGKKFSAITTSPIKSTEIFKFGESQQLIDEKVAYNNTYFYRVRGINSFSDLGSYSEVVSIKLLDRTPPAKIKDFTVKALNEESFEIQWSVAGLDLNNVRGFNILRSITFNGSYEPITAQPVSRTATSTVDKSPFLGTANFYKIEVVDKYDQTSESLAMMGILPNESAPAQPQGLQGEVDSLGVVSLAWKLGDEADLKGYRVFRADNPSFEFEQLTKSPIAGNFYNDTLSLKTLKKKIHYKVIAFDNYYKASEASAILSLEIPDLIPPVAPVLLEGKKSKDSVALKWLSSPSKDVANYRIYRKNKVSNAWKLLGETALDSTFIDKTVLPNTQYQYMVKAVDNSKWESPPSNLINLFSGSAPLAKPPELSGRYNKKTKHFELIWKHFPAKKGKMTIYRGETAAVMDFYGTVDLSKLKFVDDAFYKNDTGYVYQAKAIFRDGSASELSNLVKVNLR